MIISSFDQYIVSFSKNPVLLQFLFTIYKTKFIRLTNFFAFFHIHHENILSKIINRDMSIAIKLNEIQ